MSKQTSLTILCIYPFNVEEDFDNYQDKNMYKAITNNIKYYKRIQNHGKKLRLLIKKCVLH